MAYLENEKKTYNCWLATNRLSLTAANTESMAIGSNQRIHALSNNQTNIEIDGQSIEKVKEAKSLGLVIDERLSWTRHIDEMGRKIPSAIGALNV